MTRQYPRGSVGRGVDTRAGGPEEGGGFAQDVRIEPRLPQATKAKDEAVVQGADANPRGAGER